MFIVQNSSLGNSYDWDSYTRSHLFKTKQKTVWYA